MRPILNFVLYILVDKDSELGYPYVGVSEDTKHLIFIGNDLIAIDNYHEADERRLIIKSYVRTSRYFTFDFFYFHHVVKEYTDQGFYELTANFTGRKGLMLRYTTGNIDKFDKNELIYISRPKKSARKLAEQFHHLQEIWKNAFEIM